MATHDDHETCPACGTVAWFSFEFTPGIREIWNITGDAVPSKTHPTLVAIPQCPRGCDTKMPGRAMDITKPLSAYLGATW